TQYRGIAVTHACPISLSISPPPVGASCTCSATGSSCSASSSPPSPVPPSTSLPCPTSATSYPWETSTVFEEELEHVGRVLGLEPATTAEFRVLIDEANYLQLDDLVVVRTMVPKAGEVRIYGVVT